MDPLGFLEAVTGFAEDGTKSSADRPVKLATIDPAYSPWVGYPDAPPPARVTFDGETTLSGKAYGYASGFIPWAGMRVFMVPIGNSYLIGGALNPQSPQGFWQNAAGTESGVELGGGSYYDTDEGLVIAGDASVSGDLDVGRHIYQGARNVRVPEFRMGTVTMSTGANAASIATNITFSPAYPVGSSLVIPSPNLNTTAGNSAGVYPRAHNISVTGFTITLLQADAARTAGIPAGFSASVHWVVFGTAPD